MAESQASHPRLSVNINKIATLRNSRGGPLPDLVWAMDTALDAGAQGITIHPREDQRHITRDDIFTVARHLRENYPGRELNIEGDIRPDLLDSIAAVKPDQVTLVPVDPGEITSSHGWDFAAQAGELEPVVADLKKQSIRVSAFANSNPEEMKVAARLGLDRVEFYTGSYALADTQAGRLRELQGLATAIQAAREQGLGVNAGHDLDLENLPPLLAIPGIDELSIGHRLICHALKVGLGQSVRDFLNLLAGQGD